MFIRPSTSSTEEREMVAKICALSLRGTATEPYDELRIVILVSSSHAEFFTKITNTIKFVLNYRTHPSRYGP